MRARILTRLEDLRTNYWFVPSVMAGFAVLLSFVTLTIDQEAQEDFLRNLGFVWTGGPDGARSLLSAVASSMITVAGVTFSITIVALSLASSQFGPRLLRNFMRDRGNQIVLGTIIATFVYSLLVLRTIRNTNTVEFVPFLSTTIAVLMTLASIAVLIFFIHNTALSIQAPIVIARVAEELLEEMDHIFPDELGYDKPGSEPGKREQPQHTMQVIKSQHSGYLEAVNGEKLMQVATENDFCICLDVRPGDFLTEGSRLAGVSSDSRISDGATKALQDSFITGRQRTPTQNIEFMVDQLVEVAVRALSSGINDPFTAMGCIDWLGAALSRFAERQFPSPQRYDEQNNLRVIVSRPETFAGVANAAIDQIRQYSRSAVGVQIRLLEMLTEVVKHTRNETDRLPLQQQAAMIRDEAESSDLQVRDRQAIEERYLEFLSAIQKQRERTEE